MMERDLAFVIFADNGKEVKFLNGLVLGVNYALGV
jgi:hypothetical protein